MLVVIAVIGVIVALLLPAVQKVRAAAQRTQCQNNLREIALGLHCYHNFNLSFPKGVSDYIGVNNSQAPRLSWFTYLLPYLDQQNLYQNYLEWQTANPAQYALLFPLDGTILPSFMCPADPANPKNVTPFPISGQGFHGNYAGCAGSGLFNGSSAYDRTPTSSANPNGTALNGIFYAESATTLEAITDGRSNTLLLGEINLSADAAGHDVRGRYWNHANAGSVLFSTYYPPNTSQPDRLTYCQTIQAAPCTTAFTDMVLSARSYHTGLAHFARADGSVCPIANGVNLATYQALGTRNGGETLEDY